MHLNTLEVPRDFVCTTPKILEFPLDFAHHAPKILELSKALVHAAPRCDSRCRSGPRANAPKKTKWRKGRVNRENKERWPLKSCMTRRSTQARSTTFSKKTWQIPLKMLQILGKISHDVLEILEIPRFFSSVHENPTNSWDFSSIQHINLTDSHKNALNSKENLMRCTRNPRNPKDFFSNIHKYQFLNSGPQTPVLRQILSPKGAETRRSYRIKFLNSYRNWFSKISKVADRKLLQN